MPVPIMFIVRKVKKKVETINWANQKGDFLGIVTVQLVSMTAQPINPLRPLHTIASLLGLSSQGVEVGVQLGDHSKDKDPNYNSLGHLEPHKGDHGYEFGPDANFTIQVTSDPTHFFKVQVTSGGRRETSMGDALLNLTDICSKGVAVEDEEHEVPIEKLHVPGGKVKVKVTFIPGSELDKA